LGDDADEINLDLTLERYAATKAFLLKILTAFILESKIPSAESLLTAEDVNRAAGDYDSSKREELEKDTDNTADKSLVENKLGGRGPRC
jgi:hypothetical protein